MVGWGEGRAATADDDAELMRLVVARDVQAFERLYRRHHARLVGLVVVDIAAAHGAGSQG